MWPTSTSSNMDSEIQNALKYLARFGYIQDTEETGAEVKEIPADVLVKFQEFHGIPTTGVLDDASLHLMKLPRCRVKDFQPDSLHRSCRHLTMPDSPLAYNWGKWEKTKLTWRVTQYSRRSGMPKELVHQGLRRAFSKWEKHSPIRFEWVDTGVPDIEIRWEMEDHGDGDEFDGEGGCLAHAFLPNGDRISGDLHFDDAEMWTLGTAEVGVNLTQAAAHEVGHSLIWLVIRLVIRLIIRLVIRLVTPWACSTARTQLLSWLRSIGDICPSSICVRMTLRGSRHCMENQTQSQNQTQWLKRKKSGFPKTRLCPGLLFGRI